MSLSTWKTSKTDSTIRVSQTRDTLTLKEKFMNIKRTNIPVLVAHDAYVGQCNNHGLFAVYLEKNAFWKILNVLEDDTVIYTTDNVWVPKVVSGREYQQMTIQHNSQLIAEMSPLDDVERKYLKAVIKPFRDKVTGIIKVYSPSGKNAYISIRLGNAMFDDRVNLPYFKHDSMYRKMDSGRTYTVEELGL